jgi:S-formylglutathione hydrolase FrmB
MSQHGISRRTALAAGLGIAAAGAVAAGGYGLIEAGTLPGKYRLARLMGTCGSPPPPPRGPLPVRHETQFWSAYRRRLVHMVTLIPAGAGSPRGLGVIVALHGLGGDAVGTAASLALAMASDQIAPTQIPPTQIPQARASGFAVLTVDGGSTYWHRRADGDDPQGMIIHEVLPRAAALGLRTDRIGIAGDSMGGYGALLLAERLGGGDPATAASTATASDSTASTSTTGSRPAAQPRAAAVAALSPAIFASYTDARQADKGSFDGPADFARNNVVSQIAALRQVPVLIACGDDDPFEAMAELMRTRLQRLTGHPPAGGIETGCHDYAFWARNWPAALTFIGTHLA